MSIPIKEGKIWRSWEDFEPFGEDKLREERCDLDPTVRGCAPWCRRTDWKRWRVRYIRLLQGVAVGVDPLIGGWVLVAVGEPRGWGVSVIVKVAVGGGGVKVAVGGGGGVYVQVAVGEAGTWFPPLLVDVAVGGGMKGRGVLVVVNAAVGVRVVVGKRVAVG